MRQGNKLIEDGRVPKRRTLNPQIINDVANGYYLDGIEAGYKVGHEDGYTVGGNDAKREISLSGEYERAYQRGYEDGKEFGKIQANAIEYQNGYEEGQKSKVEVVHSTEVDEAYKRGLSDAWEIMRKIHSLDMVVRKETFGYFNPGYLIKEYSVQDAINILREEEEKEKQDSEEIRVGDEVYINDKGKKAVVSKVQDNGLHNIVFCNGDTACVDRPFIAKTGRHFDIDKVLEQMGENIS